MSTIPCNIIKDLLPLYIDDVCSVKTAREIEDHLASCESCRDVFDSMNTDLPPVSLPEEKSDAEKSIEFFKKINRTITFRQTLKFGIVTIILILLLAFATNFESVNDFLFRVSDKDISVTELYQLEDGNIYASFKSEKGVTNITDYFSPNMSDWQTSADCDSGIWFRSSPVDRITSGRFSSDKTCSIVFSPSVSIHAESTPLVYSRRVLYYEGQNYSRKVIWEKGMTLKPAPDSIEETVKNPSEDQLIYFLVE